MQIRFSIRASTQIDELESHTKEMVLRKIYFFAEQSHPIKYSKFIKQFGLYRFRIGDYRALFKVQNDVIIIISVRHRSIIYLR